MKVAWLRNNAWVFALLLVPAVILTGLIQGAAAGILVLLAAVLISVIALFWSSLRTAMGETPLSGADAYAIAAPRAEEEQKQAVLRALKDLEFERSVGKISNEDYAALVTQYRAEAKRLLRVIDEGARPGRARVEGLVRERLVAAGLEAPPPEEAPPPVEAKPTKGKKKKKAKAPAEPQRSVEIVPVEPPRGSGSHIEATWTSPAASPAPAAAAPDNAVASGGPTLESAAPAPIAKVCAECDTRNDLDANFCKKCGSRKFKNIGSAGPDEGGPPAAKAEDGAPGNASDKAHPEEEEPAS